MIYIVNDEIIEEISILESKLSENKTINQESSSINNETIKVSISLHHFNKTNDINNTTSSNNDICSPFIDISAPIWNKEFFTFNQSIDIECVYIELTLYYK